MLADALFEMPGNEYRGAPFWAWNGPLDSKVLDEQIDVFERMGMGGFHMHVRTGLDVPYMGEAFLDFVAHCVKRAKDKGMRAYLYDEDRWPSGVAGGMVTSDRAYAARQLRITPERICGREPVATFETNATTWYAYVEIAQPEARYNGQPYVNTLDKRAIERFTALTHRVYHERIGEEFGKTVAAIFTDEPQFCRKQQLGFSAEKKAVLLPWADDLPETFFAAYGTRLLEHLPELIWELPDGQISQIRYQYHDHVAERFAQAFADTCGDWCHAHYLPLTGHMMEEPTLESQTCALGEAMRSYRAFDIPGIDMLCARFELTTAKQCQSAVHQYGRKSMMSELYGVTDWDFDFRGHKLHGDWQAALGVTLRVPHLSWMSMAGEAKRDYPASIFFQSPWWQDYAAVEDHFARLNTALTRGKPLVRVAVIHPVESYWLHWGPIEQTAAIRDQLETMFQDTTRWLLEGAIDFDFISEALLPSQCEAGGAPLRVGEMAYAAIIVPGCETLRSSTLARLERFADAGGQLVFMGEAPLYENALASERGRALWARSMRVAPTASALLGALEGVRMVDIRTLDGSRTDNLLHQLRRDGNGLWLFIAHGREPYNKDISSCQQLRIRLMGAYKPTVYNTLTGQKEEIDHRAAEGMTEIHAALHDYDSLLLYLEPAAESSFAKAMDAAWLGKRLTIPDMVDYTRSEPNALLLDQAEYALDDAPWQAREEILRADDVCRRALGWRLRSGKGMQPWAEERQAAKHSVRLRFHILCEVAVTGASLAAEELDGARVTLNGEPVAIAFTGWYVDACLKTIALPQLLQGENILEIQMPYAPHINLEWMYLLGDFGVRVRGRQAVIVPQAARLGFGDITRQEMPFYGGNITWHVPFTSGGGAVRVRTPHYRGAAVKVAVDDRAAELAAYPPYSVALGELPAGEHCLHITLLGHRRNGFGAVHLADSAREWIGPDAWRSTGDAWTYEYRLREMGLLSAPIVEESEEENAG